MDPGGVIWMPGSGFNQSQYDEACAAEFGDYHSCGTNEWYTGTLVYCCPN